MHMQTMSEAIGTCCITCSTATHHARVDGGGVRPQLVLHRVLVLALVPSQDAVDLQERRARDERVRDQAGCDNMCC